MFQCHIEERSDGILAVVSGEFTVAHAQDFKVGFLPWEERQKPLHIDLSGVTQIDLAGMQLLYALWQWGGHPEHPLTLVKPLPETVAGSVALAGFHRSQRVDVSEHPWIFDQGAH